MTKNFKIAIEYDGSCYHGWQRQKKYQSIQAEIEMALEKMTSTRVTLIGSGRTDAGAHATGQVANFKCDTHLAPTALLSGLNSLLPDDIIIKDCELVATDFHARYDARSKVYHYKILNRSVPAAIGRQYAWFIRKPMDRQTIRAAMAHIIGRHDFKAFEGSGSPRQNTIREVFSATLIEAPGGKLIFEIEAEGFLRYMVRNIVGTLVDVGLGKITAADLQKILDSKDRSRAGITAPAKGLTLIKVKY
ncbi:MAG: tRNA pseudouridine(38-40) synthase TruA [Desulfobacterales bacterium]|jgi:tRNA pseudouridine38-40 synthase